MSCLSGTGNQRGFDNKLKHFFGELLLTKNLVHDTKGRRWVELQARLCKGGNLPKGEGRAEPPEQELLRAKVSVRWEISKEKDVFLHLHCGFSFQSTIFSEGMHGLSVPPTGIFAPT